MYILNKMIILFIVSIIPFIVINAYEDTKQSDKENLKTLFDQRYQIWREYVTTVSSPQSDIDPNVYFDNEPFRDIIKLGTPAISFIIEKQQEDHLLGYALYKITKFKWHTKREGENIKDWIWFVEEFPDIREKSGPPDSRKLWVRWWNDGRKMTNERFVNLYKDWKLLKQQQKEKESNEIYQKIIELGIAALPNLMDNVKNGDADLIPAISNLTEGKVKKSYKKEECAKWWEENQDKFNISFEINKPEEK